MRRRREHGPNHDLAVMFAAIAGLTLIYVVAVACSPTDSAPTSEAPTPTTVDRAAHSPSRGEARPAPPEPAGRALTPADAEMTGKHSASAGPYETALACIRAHESDTAGGYQAVNVTSGAAGAYQLMPALSDDWARRYGHPQWAHLTADQWPPAVQDDVAAQLYADWPGAWAGSGC